MQKLISPTTYTTSAISGATGIKSGVELFFHNFDYDTEESTIWRLFGPFGAVLNVTVCFLFCISK